ncbi:hypothetical protein ACN6AT_34740 [Streptomyces sp. JL4002]|uniref:hypothetical protein n=1 Tax=Streptomyces sp. JL4002 TaxID=3404781 RepID=UPI003B28CA19
MRSWAPTLTRCERRLAHRTEVLLYALTFAVHVGLVLKHQLRDRDGLLRRML